MTHQRGRRTVIAIVLTTITIFAQGSAPAGRSDPANWEDDERNHPPLATEYTPGEVVVKFKDHTSDGERSGIHARADVDVRSRISRLNVDRVKSRRGETTQSLLNRYRGNPHVAYVEPNFIVNTVATPNDPQFSALYGLNNVGQTGGTPDADIDAPEAWDLQTGSQNVLVADIDTGVDYTHGDLAANIWTNPAETINGVDDDGNGLVDDIHGWNFVASNNHSIDDNGHGTHTAGTIAAVGNNTIGVAGVAWRASVMSVKFLDQSGSGFSSDAAEAIIYAADMGARIANNSWGSSAFSQVIEDAIAYADARGMLFIAAAGNDGMNNDVARFYPCSSRQGNVLCVAATDHDDQRAVFSNYGQKTVDLGAPGSNILSTVPTGTCQLCDASGYQYLSGTSMATPHVTGAAALLLSQFPNLTTTELKALLVGSVDPKSTLAGVTTSGGRLNVSRALASHFAITIDPPDLSLVEGDTGSYTVTVRSLSGFNAPVTLSLSTSNPAISGSFSPNPVTPPPDGSTSATLTIDPTTPADRGSHLLTIQGTDGSGETHANTAGLRVNEPDFTLSVSPTARAVSAGQDTSWIITIRSIDEYSGPVDLTLSAGLLPGSISPNTVFVPADGLATALLSLSTVGSTPVGDYSVLIQGNDGPRQRNAQVTVSVIDPLNDPTPPQAWARTYDGPNHLEETFPRVATDASGDVFISGSSCLKLMVGSFCNNDWDYATVKYDPSGTQLWARRYDGGYRDVDFTLAADSAGDAYVAGESGVLFGIFTTLKYNGSGGVEWMAQSQEGQEPTDIAVDSAGDIYVSGFLNGFPRQFVVVKYAPDGRPLWTSHIPCGVGYPYALAIDEAGNSYVAGYYIEDGTADQDFFTVKIDPAGHPLWTARYNHGGLDTAYSIGVDQSGNVTVTGSSFNGNNYDYATVQYDADGHQRWAAIYDHGGNDGIAYFSKSLGVDGQGNVYVTGDSFNGLNYDYATVKYDSDGHEQWVARYDHVLQNDHGKGLALDINGNIYVVGSSWNGGNWDMATVAYDPQGRQLWVHRYDASGRDVGRGIAVTPFGAVASVGETSINNLPDFVTIAYGNRPPRLIPTGSYTVKEGVPLEFVVNGVDPDGDALTFSATGLPPGASFDAPTRRFSWTPDFTQAGHYKPSFTVTDGQLSDSETATITVSNVSQAPVLDSIGPKTVDEGALLSFVINGSDADGDALSFGAEHLPGGARFNATNRTFSWRPAYTQAGLYNVTFTVSEKQSKGKGRRGNTLTDSEVVTITVNDVPQ